MSELERSEWRVNIEKAVEALSAKSDKISGDVAAIRRATNPTEVALLFINQ
jgi:hypothetical protein